MSTNPAIYEAMQLQGDPASYHDNPEAPINIGGQMMDPAAVVGETMQMAGHYMKENGPPLPMHSLTDREAGLDQNKMTKSQVKEQVMNEDQGYPSNLGEANKTKELENRVTGIENGISQILSRLQGDPPVPSFQPSQPVSVPIGGSLVSPVGQTTQDPAVTATVQPPNLLPSTPTASNVLEPRQQPRRQVTLSDGRKITEPGPASPLSLGPAVGVQELPPNQLENDDDGWGDPVEVLPVVEEEIDAEEARRGSELLKTQQMVQEVNAFMGANDVHRFWRRHVRNSLHRHLEYNEWPPALQRDFDQRFKGFLQDPQFVSSLCKKIVTFQQGHAIGVKHLVAYIVAAAGFTAFALSGID